MSICPLFQKSSFGPAEIRRMTDADEECLRLLRLSDRSDSLTELVAMNIVAITKTGEGDPAIIAERAIRLAIR